MMKEIVTGIATASLLMSIQTPVMAKQCMELGIESPHGGICPIVDPDYAYAGSAEFQFQLGVLVGIAKDASTRCPGVHASIQPVDPSYCND